MNAKTIAVAIASAIAGAAIGLGGVAGAATAQPARNGCAEQSLAQGVTEHHATGHVSLWTWAQQHGQYVQNIVRDTIDCGNGGYVQIGQSQYFGRKDAYTTRMPKGMLFYADRL